MPLTRNPILPTRGLALRPENTPQSLSGSAPPGFPASARRVTGPSSQTGTSRRQYATGRQEAGGRGPFP